MTADAQGGGLQGYKDSEGNHYITGCVTYEFAEILVAHAGFEYGGGPAYILCADGYVQVTKRL